MPNLLANGIRVYYEEEGEGPPMVWAHGLFGTLHDWDETIASFRGRYRVVAYDARGHGRSEVPDRPEAYSHDIIIEDMRGVLDALGIARAVIGGHSMGGNVALNFALRYPERCLAVIPVSTGAGSTDSQWWHDLMGGLADMAVREGMAAVLEEMRKMPNWASALGQSRLGDRIRQQALDSSPGAMASTIRGALMKRPSIFQLESELRKMPVKAQLVAGELDTPVIEASGFMARQIPEVSLEIIPGVGHYPHLEAPEVFLPLVKRFLDRVSVS